MKPTIFTGAAAAIVTPFLSDGNVNYPLLKILIDFQIENGTAAIVACGTTGEASTLTDEEHIEVIRKAVEYAAGRVPVIAGTGSNDTAYAIELTKEAKAAGADATLQVTPYYNKTSQSGLIAHFTAIAEAGLPVILYNVPSRTGMSINPETYRALADHPGIVATKEALPDIGALINTIRLCGENLTIYSGNDDTVTAFMALGAKGVISTTSNVAPKAMSDMVSTALAGDFSASAALQTKYSGLIASLFCEVNPIPVKEALTMMGYPVGSGRLPLVPISQANRERVKSSMQAVGLI